MNCTFRVLWFEDTLPWYRSQEPAIKRMIHEHQLNDDITQRDGLSLDVDELKDNSYDLIIMDYKLAGQKTGEALIKAIREAQVLTDILFYSSDYDNMIKAASQQQDMENPLPPMDGVYYAERKEFSNKAKLLIGKIVHRSENIEYLRGFVLDAASDFETRIVTLLGILWQKSSDEIKTIMNEVALAQLSSKEGWLGKQAARIRESSDPFTVVLKNRRYFSNANYLAVLERIIEQLKLSVEFPSNEFCDSFSTEYHDCIAICRNALGHRTSKDKSLLIKEKEVELNSEFHKTMRNNIRHVNSLIVMLEEYVEKNV